MTHRFTDLGLRPLVIRIRKITQIVKKTRGSAINKKNDEENGRIGRSMTDRNVDPYCKGVDENGYHDPLTRMKLSQQLVSNEFPFFTSIFRCVTHYR